MMSATISVRRGSWFVAFLALMLFGCAHSRPSLYPNTRAAAKPVVIGDRFHIPEPYKADTNIVRPRARVRTRVIAPAPAPVPPLVE